METISKWIYDIAEGDFIKQGREWIMARGPAVWTNGPAQVPAYSSTGVATTAVLYGENVTAAASGFVPRPFTPAGVRRGAMQRQEKIDQLADERDRMLAFADELEGK